jgi:hypothetical protein
MLTKVKASNEHRGIYLNCTQASIATSGHEMLYLMDYHHKVPFTFKAAGDGCFDDPYVSTVLLYAKDNVGYTTR